MTTITEEQPKLVEEFQNIINTNMLSHAYLIDQASSAVRKNMAIWIAQSQFCPNCTDGLPDQTCDRCVAIAEMDNPDVLVLSTDKQSIGVDDVQFFKREANMSSTQGAYKFLIIEEAQKLTNAASNKLLKTIEEPEGNLVVILLVQNANQLLPTIISRVQIFHLSNESSNSELTDLVEMGYNEQLAEKLLSFVDINTLANIEPEDCQKLLTAIINYLKQLNSKDLTAFISVQKDIMPLINNKNEQEFVFDVLNQIFSDILSIRFNFKNSVLTNQDYLESINIDDIVRDSEFLFMAKEKWQSNVAFQAAMEDLTLKLLE
ncbi:DNA polymerase III subunit delta' [Companilactobacillus metriopterae]|uniref:DNA polymerase III subunit delta' n=1 Tax=Companilactobacillus metriopterae TaxID=1909267 RepID=UPI00100A5970|nr:DNA polymerase III subunit delta' [Companilactobacillus metriopterae]